MSMNLNVKGTEIKLFDAGNADYLSLTDIAKYNSVQGPDDIIHRWLKSRNTLEFISMWEQLNNPAFDLDAFEKPKDQASVLSPKQWLKATSAIGLIAKSGRYCGLYAHKDIAFEFAGWLCIEFKLCLVKAFHDLKDKQDKQLGWKVRRDLTKINYRLHTNAIQRNLITKSLDSEQIGDIYSTEADIINMAMFGKTAAQWREENPRKKGNIRDTADLAQLVFLANMENLNATFIAQGLAQSERAIRINQLAKEQMAVLQ